jgi:hypothetical protein
VVSGRFRGVIACKLGRSDRVVRGHQLADERGACFGGEIWIGHSPQLAADDEIASAQRHRMLESGHRSDERLAAGDRHCRAGRSRGSSFLR